MDKTFKQPQLGLGREMRKFVFDLVWNMRSHTASIFCVSADMSTKR